MTPRKLSGLEAMPAAAPVRVVAQESSFSGIAFKVLLIFLFLAISRILDFTLPRLHLPLVFGVLAAGLIFISHGITAFSTKIGKFAGLFTLWLVICIPFSQWKGGSFALLQDELSRSILIFMMVGTAANSLRKVQSVISIVGCAVVVTMGIALWQNVRIDGRLTMAAGQYSNSNDLAQVILLGMCFLPVLGVRAKSRFLKILSYGMILPLMYTLFVTGSRAGLVAMLVLAGVVFMAASVGKKLALIVLMPILLGGLLTTSPALRLRMKTLVQASGPVAMGSSEDMAISSTQSRMDMLKQSIELTVKNPLFGVGPGVFQAAAADLQRSIGQRASWLETHNAYTQVSSEMGFPGAIFFLGMVVSSITGLLRVRSRAKSNPSFEPIRTTSEALLLGFITFAVTSFFSSVAYGFIFWTLFGLCSSAILTLQREMEAATQRPQPATVTRPTVSQNPILLPQAQTAHFPAARGMRITLSGRVKMRRSKPSQGIPSV